MGQAPPNLLVSLVNQVAFVKIIGRANFTYSVHFKTLIQELQQHHIREFILDLTECATMDSTFLGVLAGFALKSADATGDRKTEFELFNPSPRITDLLDNLGVSHLFTVVQCPTPETSSYHPSASDAAAAPSREELSRVCLEAHQTLMAINPENIPKFKEVTQFLAEDLKKAKGGT